MIADRTKETPKKSVEIGTKEPKKPTNLSLSGDCLQMAEALKAATRRPSTTNLVESLIHEAYTNLSPKQKEEAKRLMDEAKKSLNGNGVHSTSA